MNLRVKAFMIVSLPVAVLVIILAVVSHTIVMQGILRLERQAMSKDVGRVQAALSKEIAGLNSIAADWAAWDDAYQFMADENADFEQANLIDETFDGLNLSLMMWVDPNGPAFGQLVKTATGEPQVFEWLAKDREGRAFWTEVSLKRIDVSGQLRFLAIGRDISERKRLEAQFLQVQKWRPSAGWRGESLATLTTC